MEAENWLDSLRREEREYEADTAGMIGRDTSDGADLCLACEIDRLTRALLDCQLARDETRAELAEIRRQLTRHGVRVRIDGEPASLVDVARTLADALHDRSEAARALLALYDSDPAASDGPEADAAWAALRKALGDEEPTP